MFQFVHFNYFNFRLEEAVKFADKEGGKDLELSKSYSVKLDFMTAKVTLRRFATKAFILL